MSVKTTAKVCGVTILVLLLLFAALGPAKLQVRTGLGWRFDHVAGYLGFTVLFCLAWPRPFIVGGTLMTAAMLLEALQSLTPDRCCDFEAVLWGVSGSAGGALAVLLALNRKLIWLKGRALLMSERLRPRWLLRNNVLPYVVSAISGIPTIEARLTPARSPAKRRELPFRM